MDDNELWELIKINSKYETINGIADEQIRITDRNNGSHKGKGNHTYSNKGNEMYIKVCVMR